MTCKNRQFVFALGLGFTSCHLCRLDEIQTPLLEVMANISHVFLKEPMAFVACVVRSEWRNRPDASASAVSAAALPEQSVMERTYLNTTKGYQFVLFPAQKEDLTCLLSPPVARSKGVFIREAVEGDHPLEVQLVDFINTQTKRHRKLDGFLNPLVRFCSCVSLRPRIENFLILEGSDHQEAGKGSVFAEEGGQVRRGDQDPHQGGVLSELCERLQARHLQGRCGQVGRLLQVDQRVSERGGWGPAGARQDHAGWRV